MTGKMLALLTGLAMLGSVGVTSAAEPTALTEEQMDAVVAGGAVIGNFDCCSYYPFNYNSGSATNNGVVF